MNIGSIVMKPFEISAKVFGASAELIDTYKYYSKLFIVYILMQLIRAIVGIIP
jgi:hypothetical protein